MHPVSSVSDHQDGAPPAKEIPSAPEPEPWLGRATRWSAAVVLGLILCYATALRLEAATARFGFRGKPHRIMRQIRAWHPRGLNWAPVTGEHYQGDPFSYLGFARDMRGFYDASVREPMYVFVTRVGLYFSNDQDWGISLASGSASVLLVLATYLLGSTAFGRGAGLLAALAMAVERYVVGLAIEGWRDDAFALMVVLWAYALLRLKREQTFAAAVVAGLVGGAACLTRITALSFLVPGYGILFLATTGWSRRRRLELIGISSLLVAILVVPYLVNCAIVYDDPLYSINYHTGFYLERSNVAPEGESFIEFLRARFRPFELVDTIFVGLTGYPFENKWRGFDYWFSGLGRALSYASLVGCWMALWLPQGRVLWLLYLSALLPFASTYETPGGAEFRFTLFAYPFLLIGSGLALTTMARFTRPSTLRRHLLRLTERKRAFAWGAAGNLLALALVWTLSSALLYWRTEETVASGRTIRVHTGPRDLLFFGRGWHRPSARGNIIVRITKGSSGLLYLPLVEGRSYALDFRVDPISVGDAPAFLTVCANGIFVAGTAIEKNTRRVGSYSIRLPASAVEDGRDRLRLMVTTEPNRRCEEERDGDVSLLFLFVRIRPLV